MVTGRSLVVTTWSRSWLFFRSLLLPFSRSLVVTTRSRSRLFSRSLLLLFSRSSSSAVSLNSYGTFPGCDQTVCK